MSSTCIRETYEGAPPSGELTPPSAVMAAVMPAVDAPPPTPSAPSTPPTAAAATLFLSVWSADRPGP